MTIRHVRPSDAQKLVMLFTLLAGLLMAQFPWYLFGPMNPHLAVYFTNCFIAGSLAAGFALWGFFFPFHRWPPFATLVAGLWLLLSPDTFSYEMPIMTWSNVLLGTLILILGILWVKLPHEKAPT